MKKVSTLIAYFSHSGNTRVVADKIHKIAGGEIFEIVPVNQYPHEYNAVVEQARKELDQDYRPALKTKAENIYSYDLVFIGYPNWWGTIPRPVAAFLQEYDLAGKTIAPFCTHEGSGLGRSVEEIKSICSKSTVMNGLAIRGGNVKNSQEEINIWLLEVGFKD
ncbi:flavodoxin [Methanolacinia petrolearia]|uniref:flavodoxin n=1 Tax=Methanolacinia petrolearia TaxID=54120 RepID=UPI003BAB2CB5